jgi:hypothetical protein
LFKKVVEVVEVAKAEEVKLLVRNIGRSCFNCGEKGHPSSSCMKPAVANNIDSTSIAHSIEKLAKETKNLKKAFAQLQKTSKQDSNLDSESEEEDSHFQFDDGFQFTQMEVKQMAIEFKPCIAKLFKQMHGTRIKLDLKTVLLLDSQSTMDLICDQALVESTFKSSHRQHATEKQWWNHGSEQTGNHVRMSYAHVVQ